MQMRSPAGHASLLLFAAVVFTSLDPNDAYVNYTLSDCSFYDDRTSTCLSCYVERSDHQEFYKNFKEKVPEMECQAHIASNAKELIFDVNSKQVFASVSLSTTLSTFHYTKKILFEFRYNCESDDRCTRTEFFGVLLDNIGALHRDALKNLIILLPLEAIKDSAMKDVQVRSHSQDACGGLFSSYTLSTDNITAKYLSSKLSDSCYTSYGHLELNVEPVNISGQLLDIIPGFRPQTVEDNTPQIYSPENTPDASMMFTDSGKTKSNTVWKIVFLNCFIAILGFSIVLAISYFFYSRRHPEHMDPFPVPGPPMPIIGGDIPLFINPPSQPMRRQDSEYDSIDGAYSEFGDYVLPLPGIDRDNTGLTVARMRADDNVLNFHSVPDNFVAVPNDWRMPQFVSNYQRREVNDLNYSVSATLEGSYSSASEYGAMRSPESLTSPC